MKWIPGLFAELLEYLLNESSCDGDSGAAEFPRAQKEELITFIPVLSGFRSHAESDRPRRRASLLAFTGICMPEEANSCSIVSNYAKNVQRWFEKQNVRRHERRAAVWRRST